MAAMSLNRVIGCGGKIPWHLPEDFRWFKRMTMGHVLVMGRKTFESIGRPLPGRETLVLSRAGFAHPGVRTVRSAEEIAEVTAGRVVFVCGGAEVYAQLLPRCHDLYLSVVGREVEGDAFFPEFESGFELAAVVAAFPEFEIRHYRRR
jgi:dihydrofolate reductase